MEKHKPKKWWNEWEKPVKSILNHAEEITFFFIPFIAFSPHFYFFVLFQMYFCAVPCNVLLQLFHFFPLFFRFFVFFFLKKKKSNFYGHKLHRIWKWMWSIKEWKKQKHIWKKIFFFFAFPLLLLMLAVALLSVQKKKHYNERKLFFFFSHSLPEETKEREREFRDRKAMSENYFFLSYDVDIK